MPSSGPTRVVGGQQRGGHWVAKSGQQVSASRYGVYPRGSYAIGDFWYEVVEYIDLGPNHYNGSRCGNPGNPCASGYYRSYLGCGHVGIFDGCFWGIPNCSGGCPGCWTVFGCRCSYTCSSYAHNWLTRYKIWTYSGMSWHDNGDLLVTGYFWQ